MSQEYDTNQTLQRILAARAARQKSQAFALVPVTPLPDAHTVPASSFPSHVRVHRSGSITANVVLQPRSSSTIPYSLEYTPTNFNNTWSTSAQTTISPPRVDHTAAAAAAATATATTTSNTTINTNTNDDEHVDNSNHSSSSSLDILMQISTPFSYVAPVKDTNRVAPSALDLLQSVSTLSVSSPTILSPPLAAPYLPPPPPQTDDEDDDDDENNDLVFPNFPSDDDYLDAAVNYHHAEEIPPPPPDETDDEEEFDENENENENMENEKEKQKEKEKEMLPPSTQLLQHQYSQLLSSQPPSASKHFLTRPKDRFLFSPAQPSAYSKLMCVGSTPGQERRQHQFSSALQQSPPLALQSSSSSSPSPTSSKMLVNMNTNVHTVLAQSLSQASAEKRAEESNALAEKSAHGEIMLHQQIVALEEANIDLQQQLEWSEEELHQKDEHIEQLELAQEEAEDILFDVIVKRLQMGTIFIKHTRRGSPHPRVVWVDQSLEYVCWRKPGTKSEVLKSIRIDSIERVQPGQHTARFHRRKGRSDRGHSSFSIITTDPDRTLDLEIDMGPNPADTLHTKYEKEQRDKWVDAFQTLVAYQRKHENERQEYAHNQQLPTTDGMYR